MTERLETIRRFREAMNQRTLDQGNLQTNRFFTLDGKAYEGGALDGRTK